MDTESEKATWVEGGRAGKRVCGNVSQQSNKEENRDRLMVEEEKGLLREGGRIN